MFNFKTKVQVEQQSVFDQNRNKYYSVVREPSPDGFNAGSSYRVESDGPLGGKGTALNVEMQMTNYAKTDNFKDKQTGQPRSITKNQSYFNVLSFTNIAPSHSAAKA